jgi:hypothetical protein
MKIPFPRRQLSLVGCVGFGLLSLFFATTFAASDRPRLSGRDVAHSLHHKLTTLPRKQLTDDAVYDNVYALIHRVLLRAGVSWAAEFNPRLELIPFVEVDGQPRDAFEIEAVPAAASTTTTADTSTGGITTLVFRGSSGVALTTAFGHYLRAHAHCDFHWEQAGNYSFAALPQSIAGLPLPVQVDRVVFLSKYRYYQNTCTASYSFAWKDWAAWEQEIDWMAMNGFNLPLAFTGQEIVWQRLWTKYGLTEEDLQQYFSGPAFLAWQRMANIRGFAGKWGNGVIH